MIEARRQRLLAAINCPSVLAALDATLAPEERLRCSSAAERLSHPELNIAVLGRQGVGKSMLLNAFLKRRVLPSDEVETTNLLVCVRGCAAGKERLEVVFQDGRIETGPLEEPFVARFAHKDNNPANALGVATLTCFVHTDVLREGESLWDTPGTDSPNRALGQTTIDFLSRVSVPILVLSAPCADASDVRFLRATWRHSRECIFVVNVWEGDDAEERMRENRRILDGIAREDGDERPVEIVAVNVHEALEGACNDAPDRVVASGLPVLVAALRARLVGGPGEAHIQVNGRALARGVLFGISTAEARIAGIDGVGESGTEAREAAVREELLGMEREWSDRQAVFSTLREELLVTFETELGEGLGAAQDRLRGHVDARRIDYGRLSESIQDELTTAAKAPKDRLERSWGHAVSVFCEQTSALEERIAGVNRPLRGVAAAGELAEGLGNLVKYGAGAFLVTFAGMGVFAGGAVLLAGEGLLVAIVAPGAAVPGIGWAIAGAALLAGLGVAALGRAVATTVLHATVNKAVAIARSSILTDVRQAVGASATRIVGELGSAVAAALGQKRAELAEIAADRRRGAAERAAVRSELLRHATALHGAGRVIAECLAPPASS